MENKKTPGLFLDFCLKFLKMKLSLPTFAKASVGAAHNVQ
jgi:hypothetical protein